MASLGLTGNEETQVRALAGRFDLTAVALTNGSDGSSLLLGDQYSNRSGTPVCVVDTVGAGDSFTAVLALGLIANAPANKILECAACVAEFVCSQPGAMPPLPASLRELVCL